MITLKFFNHEGFIQHVHEFKNNALDQDAIDFADEFFRNPGGYVALSRDGWHSYGCAFNTQELQQKFAKVKAGVKR